MPRWPPAVWKANDEFRCMTHMATGLPSMMLVKITIVTQRALPPGGPTGLPSTVWAVTTFATCRVLCIGGRGLPNATLR